MRMYGKRPARPIYTREEADERGVVYVGWREGKEGDHILSDDGVVVEVLRVYERGEWWKRCVGAYIKRWAVEFNYWSCYRARHDVKNPFEGDRPNWKAYRYRMLAKLLVRGWDPRVAARRVWPDVGNVTLKLTRARKYAWWESVMEEEFKKLYGSGGLKKALAYLERQMDLGSRASEAPSRENQVLIKQGYEAAVRVIEMRLKDIPEAEERARAGVGGVKQLKLDRSTMAQIKGAVEDAEKHGLDPDKEVKVTGEGGGGQKMGNGDGQA